MGKLSTYDIAYKGLKEGLHEFSYLIDAKFFELFDESLVNNGDVSAIVIFEKRSSLLTFSFKIKGTVELTCDRCLENYNQPIKQKVKLIVKFGENKEDQGDEFIWILPEAHQFNIAHLLYEYIILSIPIKHVHRNKKGENSCDKKMLDNLKKYSGKNKEEKTDERWDALKKLMNNN